MDTSNINGLNLRISLKDADAVKSVKEEVWKEYLDEIRKDTVRVKEVEECAMAYGDAVMKYGMQIIGEPEEGGYPLYIALHGGGHSDTPHMNDSQWKHMFIYYRDSVKAGIYINPRGVRDTWDTHGNPESYPLYDRLIMNMTAFQNVNPNRVYLLGFSAGGDGVYMTAPKMADRFAAFNMSAGHPNGIDLTNLYHTPIALQVGMKDIAFNRHLVTPEYGKKLDELSRKYGGGFVHETYVHKDKGHNFHDNKEEEQWVLEDPEAFLEGKESASRLCDTNAVRYISRYERAPLPKRVVWDLSNRAGLRTIESFYWLSARNIGNGGLIIAAADKATNTINIEPGTTVKEFTVLLNEDMLDLFRPITVVSPEGLSKEVMVETDYNLLKKTTWERGDKNYQFAAKIEYDTVF